jgi:hypothetical protein
MSLFGGEDSVPQSPEISFPSSHQRSPTPPIAHNTSLTSFVLDSDEDDEFDDNEEPKLESNDVPSRPNRFTGKPSTWRGYTAADRQVVASLENIESADLAAHLYNAHNLKRRVRRPAEQLVGVKDHQRKDSWLKKGKGLEFTDPFGEKQTELVPSKAWTTWPMPPKLIPTKESGVKEADSDEETWYIVDSGACDVGENMRNEILALFLRQAKETWLARPYEAKDQDATPKRKPRAKSCAKTLLLDSPQSVTPNVEMQDAATVKEGIAPTSESEADGNLGNTLGKTRGHKPQTPSVKAAFLADDDEARRILQPSVNSLLAQIDSLALAVRRSRLNQFGRSGYDGRSGSEFTSGAESVASDTVRLSQPTEKKSSRTCLRANDISKPNEKSKDFEAEHTTDSDLCSDYDGSHREEERDEDNSDESQPSKRKPNISKKPRQYSESSGNQSGTHDIMGQQGLMDWSEVLGIASITGWDQQVVARTAQRCAVLFGEGMSFRTFDERLATEPVVDPVHYNPSTIPCLDNMVSTNASITKRPLFEIGTLRCPHKDCFGSQKDYRIPYRVVEHVMRAHGYDPRTNDSDNEERKVGGVHIDGFLQPVTLKHGWLGGGRSKAGSKKAEVGKDKPTDPKKRKIERGTASPAVGMDDE